MSTRTFRTGLPVPETRLLLFPSGLIMDASGFVVSHADETPTSIGVPALRLRKVEAVIADVLERAWEALGSDQIIDGNERLVHVVRDGAPMLLPLESLSYLELCSILSVAA